MASVRVLPYDLVGQRTPSPTCQVKLYDPLTFCDHFQFIEDPIAIQKTFLIRK